MDSSGLVRFSTDEFPEPRRFALWREMLDRSLRPTEVTPLDHRPFHAELIMCMLPGVGITWGSNSSLRSERTRQLIADDREDPYLLMLLPLAGEATVEQNGRQARLGPGTAALATSAEPGMVSCSQDFSHVTLKLALRDFSPLVGDIDSRIARAIPADNEALQVLASYLASLRRGQSLATAELRHLVGTHIRDLAALALGATAEAADTSRSRGLRAARLKAAQTFISENLGRFDLTVGAVAVSQQISPRYLQMLFEAEGTTFSEFVIRQRLALAHRMLIDPRLAGRPIGAIALDAGFSDLSYFSRMFRRLYGRPPSDIRAR